MANEVNETNTTEISTEDKVVNGANLQQSFELLKERFDDLETKISEGGGGGGGAPSEAIVMTQAEYDALGYNIQYGPFYVITDPGL